jgi:hypothetical protein
MKTMDRTEFFRQEPTKQMNFIKSGGTLTDDHPNKKEQRLQMKRQKAERQQPA